MGVSVLSSRSRTFRSVLSALGLPYCSATTGADPVTRTPAIAQAPRKTFIWSSLALQGVLHLVDGTRDGILGLSGELFDLAFGLELLVAGERARGFLDAALYL